VRSALLACLLVACAGDPLEERMAAWRPRVEAATIETKHAGERESLSAIVWELAQAGDFELIEALERECADAARRPVYWATVARAKPGPEAQGLLQRWAQREPDVIVLAAYRPGGLEFLLSTLEDPAQAPQERAQCAWALARAGDRSALPRLRALVDDPTPVPMRSLRAGAGVPTLGNIVRDCVADLEG
jgi:nucleotide-binding universal stress UspA family protein